MLFQFFFMARQPLFSRLCVSWKSKPEQNMGIQGHLYKGFISPRFVKKNFKIDSFNPPNVHQLKNL